MKTNRIKYVLNLNISDEKLDEMKREIAFYFMLNDDFLKKNFKFRYKYLSKVLFAEYFL